MGRLDGRVILLTRRPEQGVDLAQRIEASGGTVRWCPLLRIEDPDEWLPLDAALMDLAQWDWAVFTSRNAVERTFSRWEKVGRPGGGGWPPIAVVGRGTGIAVEDCGQPVGLVPDQQDAEGLLAALLAQLAPGSRLFLPQAHNARSLLVDGLRAAGHRVESVVAYRGVATDLSTVDLDGVDAVTFASSATVERFARLQGLPPAWPNPIAIGPRTAETIAAQGQTAAAVAKDPSPEGLLVALEQLFD